MFRFVQIGFCALPTKSQAFKLVVYEVNDAYNVPYSQIGTAYAQYHGT